jgi:predicted AlkP superfamily phosphohydrolase/phosphomutase
MKAAGENVNFILISDHGMTPAMWFLNVNDWLRQVGMLTVRPQAYAQAGKKVDWKELLRRQVLGFEERHAGVGRLRRRLYLALGMQRWFGERGQAFRPELVDWGSTKAYSYGNFGEVFLNVKGREPQGIVSPQEYEGVRQYIREQLKHVDFPWTPKSICVWNREDIYEGDYIDKMADLIIEIDEFRCHTVSSLGNDSLFRRRRGGVHHPEGILMAKGPGISVNVQVTGARIEDIAPTALFLLGVPVPADMTGHVLRGALSVSGAVEYQEAPRLVETKAAVYSDEEAKMMADRLRALGYMA